MKLSVILVLAALIAAAIAGPAHSIDVEGPGCVGEVVTLISGGEWEQDNGNYAAVYELNVQNNGVCAMSTIQLDLGLPDGATVIDTWELSEGPSYYLLATYPTLDVGATGLAGFIAEFTTSPVPSSLNVTLTARCPRSCMEYFPNTQAPVDPTEEPVEPTEEPTEGPVDPTEEPVEPTEEPTEAPVDPTEEPVEPTETPTEGPVDPTEEPAEPTEEPTEAPVDPTEEPVEPSCSVSVGLQAREGGSNYSQIWDVNITNTGNSAVSSLSIDIVAADGSEVTQVWDLSLVDGTTYAVEFWEKLVANGDKHDGAGFEVVGSEDAPTVSVSAVAC